MVGDQLSEEGDLEGIVCIPDGEFWDGEQMSGIEKTSLNGLNLRKLICKSRLG